MRIYINNFNINALKEVQDTLSHLKTGSERFTQVFTDEGIYIVYDDRTYLLEPEDKDIQIRENYYKEFTLIFDHSYFKKSVVSCVQGSSHLPLYTEKFIYSLEGINTKLIIEHVYDEKYRQEYIPYDIYFELNEDCIDSLNDIIIKREIIEFLSVFT